MTTNNPNVRRFDNMGCPEEICRVDTMYESDDGDFVVYEDYKALQAENEELVEALELARHRIHSLKCVVADLRAEQAGHGDPEQ